MDAIGRWWDGVELWVTGLPFALQVLVVMIVLVPLAGLVATGADIVLAKAFVLVGRGPAEVGSVADDAREAPRTDGTEGTEAPDSAGSANSTESED
ncbi:MAG: hypothetical protein L0H59_07890 [Tomitella sp.]|nr:hypothetical protein [Tomitella sp.]